MIQVKLMGELGEKFGTDWESHDNNLRDIFAMIGCQADGFYEYLKDLFDNDIGLEVVHGDQLVFKDEEDLPKYSLPLLKDTVYLTPVPVGAGSNVLKILVGITLLIFAPYIAGYLATTSAGIALGVGSSAAALSMLTYGIMALGGLLALNGLTNLMTPDTPKNSPESYLFGNSQENIKMGHPVPLLYGELIVPGVPINFGYADQKLTSVPSGYTSVGSNTSSTDSASGSWGDGGYVGGDSQDFGDVEDDWVEEV